MDYNKTPIKASTQEHLSIHNIRDNIVILKDGSCCLILAVSAVNFDLLSEREQDAIIYAYGALLNSLNFSIQICIRSQKKDISSYLKLLEKQEAIKENNPLLKTQIQSYRKFVSEMVKKNNVLDKKFYVSIPFSALELGVSSTLTSLLKTNVTLPFTEEYILQKANISLVPKRDHLIRLFGRIGLFAKQLETKDIIKLFKSIYNGDIKTINTHPSLAKVK